MDEHNEHSWTSGISRRSMLGLLGATGLGLALAGCTDTSDGSKPAASGTPATGGFDIPNAATSLPSGNVTLHWVDSGDQKAVFFNALFDAYHKKHDNIKIDYQGTNWATIQQSIALGLRNGTAPDVFQLPAQITSATAVASGWVGALDDTVPNWSDVKSRFPAGTFANGITDFNGKTYGLPLVSNYRVDNLLLFNSDITEKADYDLANDVLTWDDFRAVAKKCTKQGNGKYYGVIFGMADAGGVSQPLATMAEMAGVHGGVDAGGGIGNTPFGGIDWSTGEFNYTNDLTVEVVELLLAMKSDGSVFPGSTSLLLPDARARMPQGVAAMMINGPWNIAGWKQSNPTFKFGVNIVPQKNPADIWPLGYNPGGATQWYFSTKSKLQPVIGDIYAYLASNGGQDEWATINGSANPPAFPDAAHNAKVSALEKTALGFGQKYRVIRPSPAVRNPDVVQAFAANVAVTPSFSDTVVGLYTGQLGSNVAKTMKDLQDRSNRGLEKAIADAKSKGAKISREDWVFTDWDPREGYTKLYGK